MSWKKLDLPTTDELREIKQEYKGKARFLVDESMGTNVAKYLSKQGYNTKYVGDESLEGRSDEDVFAFAWKEKRIIVTHDPDFLDDRRFHLIEIRGPCWCAPVRVDETTTVSLFAFTKRSRSLAILRSGSRGRNWISCPRIRS
jgi:predicted nuclease of predicted toxin-antitoxin system